jgi:hypothetical protein
MKIKEGPSELGYAPGTTIMFELQPGDSEELKEIITGILPVWARVFAGKNRKYEALAHNDLGAKGKFVDIYRKVMVLKSRLWDGRETVGESTEEVMLDMIGHLFLALNDMAGGSLRAVDYYPEPDSDGS